MLQVVSKHPPLFFPAIVIPFAYTVTHMREHMYEALHVYAAEFFHRRAVLIFSEQIERWYREAFVKWFAPTFPSIDNPDRR